MKKARKQLEEGLEKHRATLIGSNYFEDQYNSEAHRYFPDENLNPQETPVSKKEEESKEDD